jgi:branched-chain amino acid transport system ATP-binding protein
LDVSYGRAQVLFGVSLEGEEGKITSIIGPNGAGKTTLLNTISGLMRQTSGKIRFDGEDVEGIPTRERVRRGLILCPERRRLFPNLKVVENVKSGAFLRRDAQKVKEDLDYVYELFPVLKERKNQIAGTLSGGEQQMVAIARSLLSSPKLIMLDEPSLGLSPLVRSKIFEAIVKIKENSGKTVLMVEQDAVEAMGVADSVYVLENGHITMHGASSELMGSPHVREAYLGL